MTALGRSQSPNFTLCFHPQYLLEVLFYQWIIHSFSISQSFNHQSLTIQAAFGAHLEDLTGSSWDRKPGGISVFTPQKTGGAHAPKNSGFTHVEKQIPPGCADLAEVPHTARFNILSFSSLRSQVSLIKDNFIPGMNFWWHQETKNYSAVMCNEKNHSLNCIFIALLCSKSHLYVYILMYFQE